MSTLRNCLKSQRDLNFHSMFRMFSFLDMGIMMSHFFRIPRNQPVLQWVGIEDFCLGVPKIPPQWSYRYLLNETSQSQFQMYILYIYSNMLTYRYDIFQYIYIHLYCIIYFILFTSLKSTETYKHRRTKTHFF